MQGRVDRVKRGGDFRPGTSRGNPGDSLAWNGRRRDHEINIAVRLFAALGDSAFRN